MKPAQVVLLCLAGTVRSAPQPAAEGVDHLPAPQRA